jgi:hypothetical protein
LLAVIFGLATWIICEVLAPDATVPPQLAGLFASLIGMLVGGFVPAGRLKPANSSKV